MNELQSFLKEKQFDIIPEIDGKLRRFDRAGSNTGWLVCHELPRSNGEPLIVAKMGDWKTGEEFEFKSQTKFASKEEEKAVYAKLRDAKKQAEEQKERDQEDAASRAKARWSAASDAGSSTYLSRKNCEGNFGQKYSQSSSGDTEILVPCHDITGKLWGLQKISEDGTKFFMPGQKVKDLFHQIGEINEKTKRIYLCEGFATGATIFLATNEPTVCAFNAANLGNVGEKLRGKYPQIPIVICGDDDRWTQRNGEPYNPGRENANNACIGARATPVFPRFQSLDNRPTDFNDLHVREGLDAVKDQLNSAFAPGPNEIIETEFTGFHNSKLVRGQLVLTPNYEDLRKFFEREHQYRLLNGSKIVLTWNGKYYEMMEEAYLKAFAQRHFNPTATNKMVTEFSELVMRTNLTKTSWFDSTTARKINFQNGILDVETNEFLEHSPEFGFRYVLEYDYEPEAKCPRFDNMMKEVTSGDKDLERVLLEYAGYAISNDSCWAHKALILEGEGSNGKSTFMNVLRRLAGQDNYASLTLAELKGEGNRQLLDGKLFNMAEETPSRSLMESSIFKTLVSGGETQARRLYKNPYFFRNRAKLIFACNELPQSHDTTKGFLRRFIIAPFKAEFSKSLGNLDPFIEDKLAKELPGIFNRVLLAYKELSKRGSFTDSKAVNEALDQYNLAINPVLNWFEEHAICHPTGNGHDDHVATITDLYTHFESWARGHGFQPPNVNVFGKRLKTIIPDYGSRYVINKLNGKTSRFFRAISRSTGEKF